MKYDVIIIGGGSGGFAAAKRAAQLKLSVAVVEKDAMGGACLNWGCIPTKTLYKNAEFIKHVTHAERLGVDIDNFKLDVSKIQERKTEVIRKLQADIQRVMTKYNIPIYKGYASLVDKNTVKVVLDDGREKQIQADNIVIATGSVPVVPPLEGVMLDGVYTSNEMLLFNEIPEELVVVGAGVVGMEFAGIFQQFGSKVKVISTDDRILARVDEDVTRELTKEFEAWGGEVHGGVRAQRFSYDEKTGKYQAWVAKKGDEENAVPVSGDIILLSIGRKPFSTGLNLEEVGVATDRGMVIVDENMCTNIDNIYAIGDVNRVNMLAYTAANQGINVVEQIAAKSKQLPSKIFASCIFVFPELAFVGKSEMDCKAEAINYYVSKFHFDVNGKALANDNVQGFVKVIADENKKLLGVAILGPNATDLIHEAVLAIQHDMTVEDIVNTVHAHPTLAEAFWEAVNNINDAKLIKVK